MDDLMQEGLMGQPPEPGDTRLDAAEQRAQVVALRRRRLTFDAIGREMGFTAQRAHQIYKAALAAVPAQEVEEHRSEELALIDNAISDLWPLAHDGEPATRIRAWDSIRGWSERKSRLLGLDKPTRVSVEAQNIGDEIKDLIGRLVADGSDEDDD